MSSPERPGPQFNTNQVPSHFLLKYLWSELRSRQVEREQHLSKKTTYENEVTSYADVVRKEEPALIAAQKAVEYHSATIDYIRSRPTAPFPDVANDLSSSTNQSVSTEATTSLSSQLSESTRESEVLLENEERRLVKAKALLQELHVRLEEPKVHLMIRERKMKQLEELIETLDGEIHELALLMRPQLRVPDEVWLLVFGILLEEDNRLYRTKDQRWLFAPPTLTASQVCQHWRRVTHSHSSLWTKIGFQFDRYWEPRQLDLFRLVLERAGDQKVFLIVDMSSSRVHSNATDETDYVDIQSIEGIRNGKFILGVENPPRTLNLRELCDKTGITSFTAVIINGSDLRQNTGDLEQLPDTRVASFYDFYPSSSAAALEDLHSLHLYSESSRRKVDVSPFLLRGLHELTLRGDSIDLPSDSEDAFVLPELTSLRLSPLQRGFLKRVTTPRLSTLTLDPPDGPDESIGSDWSSPLLGVSSTCSIIRFDMWETLPLESPVPPYCSASAVCLEIIRGSQKPVKVQFIDSYVDGERLVSDLLALMGSGVGTKAIEEMVIDRCTGMTRMDCDALLGIVDCLKIYV
ncbi:hypothetical protein FRB91_004038 [Serendipita sp. 411]|nr:hypothetical protein FRC16_001634 [Serendipita sp. 398]KAG8842611.1 hypothetical protein FRB91_004038 [Serendipita sp. 411]KAG9058307.1 hypothetical protein FS842_010677 [Serendipita sp. 407]